MDISIIITFKFNFMMNTREFFSFKKPERNLYEILGCDISSSIDQINKEYRIKALQLHPDKNQGSDSIEEFKQLQFAKDILLDEKEKKIYDLWLRSGLNIPFEQFRSRQARHSMHWASPRSNLSIQFATNKGQGSDVIKRVNNNQSTNKNTIIINNNNNNYRTSAKDFVDCSYENAPNLRKTVISGVDWLDKFRRYEV